MAAIRNGHGLFFREFIRNFHTTGAVAPSGPYLSRALARYVGGTAERAQQVLEVGPGTGAVTRHIVPRLAAGDQLDLVELNAAFVERLQRDLRCDTILKTAADRISVQQIPVERLANDRRYDVIVSGLPLNNFSAELVEQILEQFRRLLAPGGTLSFFEYIAVRRLKSTLSGRCERQRLRQIDRILTELLAKHEVRRDCVLANLPPAWVHHVRFIQSSVQKN